MNKPPKRLLNGYVGVKFEAVKRSEEPHPEMTGLYPGFRRIGERLKLHDMTPANAGNISVRYGHGLAITASGCNLGYIEKNEIVLVITCEVETRRVFYQGPIKPSSESIMHWLIYGYQTGAKVIIHAHDQFATRPELLAGEVAETEREEPYGTVELARMAIETFQRGEPIVILKNHGYVAFGSDLDQTCDLVVDAHLSLLRKLQSSKAF